MRASSLVAFAVAAVAAVALSCDAPVSGPATRDAPAMAALLAPVEPAPIQIAAGDEHNCALLANGTASCWGYNIHTQAPASRSGTGGTFVQLAGGVLSTCGIVSDGEIDCWGNNTQNTAPATRAPGAGDYVQLDMGVSSSCALRSDGVVECWGDNAFGGAPAEVAASTGVFVHVGVYSDHGCAVRDDGAAECWGANTVGQAPALRMPNGTGVYRMIGVGEAYSCALRGNGIIECWGDDGFGRAPRRKRALSGKFRDLSVGGFHACAVRDDGVAECWGQNTVGQAPATRAPAYGKFRQVTVGQDHSCALRDDHIVECWGYDNRGQSTPLFDINYRFRGFASPQIDAPYPAMNRVPLPEEGRAIPLSFTLESDEGLGILADGFPKYFDLDCESPSDQTTGVSTAGTLSYNASTRRYTYLWEVPGSLLGGCAQFVMRLDDDTYHRANFAFESPFRGFNGPWHTVDYPGINVLTVTGDGRELPMIFRLGKDEGNDVISNGGFTQVATINCAAPVPMSSGASTTGSLRHTSGEDLYVYDWNVPPSFNGTCRQFIMQLEDGSIHRANFKFEAPEVFTVAMDPSKERPPVTEAPGATGTAMFTRIDREVFFTINVTGLTGNPVGAHIHGPATVSQNAGVIKGFSPLAATTSGALASGSFTTSGTAVPFDSVLKLMRIGKAYVNVHTPLHPNGEIRGQVVLQP